MCDSGSQVNLIQHCALKSRSYRAIPTSVDLQGITQKPVRIKQQVTIELEPWFGGERIAARFLLLPKVGNEPLLYPQQSVTCNILTEPLAEKLADPLFWFSAQAPLLLGVETYATILDGKTNRIGEKLVSQETRLGAVIMGEAPCAASAANATMQSSSAYALETEEIHKMLEKLWEFEDLELCTQKDAEHKIAEQMFTETHKRRPNGRHIVKIPIKPQVTELGSSREIALKRFYGIEKKGQRDPAYWERYVIFMRDYEESGHMVQVKTPPKRGEMFYYIPHHGIVSSEKFRVVFDGSCKTDLKISLNEAQFIGPKLQFNLHDIFMRFRRHQYTVTGDIKQMYRQVEIDEDQWNLQRIFFREKPNEPLKEYCLKVVTYGLSSSPYLSVKAMQIGALECAHQYPEAVRAIMQDFYMDDCLTGAETEEEAIKIAKDIQTVLEKSCFPITKWYSNSKKLVEQMAGDDAAKIIFDNGENTSILGLKWLPKSDEITLRVKPRPIEGKLTKRIIVSVVSQLYDPNGLVAPVITLAKMVIQMLWKQQLEWDDEVPEEIAAAWRGLWRTINELEKIRVPRWLGMTNGARVQLHGFADSSGKAYGAVIYLRIEHPNGDITTRLVASKSKVAPIKTVSIPRLELNAAKLLSTLFISVRKALELQDVQYFLWTDNIAAILWIRTDVQKLRVYVAKRVKEINDVSEQECWNHVTTEENPADLISRGIEPKLLVDNKLWFSGPSWLGKNQAQWPVPINVSKYATASELQAEYKVNAVAIKKQLEIYVPNFGVVPLMAYTKSFAKLCRIMCYVRRLITWCKTRRLSLSKTIIKSNKISQVKVPSADEKREAIKTLVRIHQIDAYANEYDVLWEKGTTAEPLPNEKKRASAHIIECSSLRALNPFMDQSKIIRVGGRAGKSDVPYDTKHPIIIEKNSRFSELLIQEAHAATAHGGAQIMAQYIRKMYWIPRLRLQLKSFITQCVICKKASQECAEQLMADVPVERLGPNKPFRFTGVDYAGPITLLEKYGRNSKKRKAWIVIFVCLVTRAVHIDLVTDMTAAAFIMCYERFVAARGHCEKFFSDNGTPFIGANKQIRAAFKQWYCKENKDILCKKNTEWKFQKPFAPHQGGIYESAVKSAKHHLKRIVGKVEYTHEYWLTFLKKVEAILNSRPLYPINDDPADMQALTPGHFLIGEPFIAPMAIASPKATPNPIVFIRREQQRLLTNFWKTWSAELVQSLMKRKKWQKEQIPPAIGQLVVIADESIGEGEWLLGRITKLVSSHDGIVRAAEVKTQKGKMRLRPIQKLCILPLPPSAPQKIE